MTSVPIGIIPPFGLSRGVVDRKYVDEVVGDHEVDAIGKAAAPGHASPFADLREASRALPCKSNYVVHGVDDAIAKSSSNLVVPMSNALHVPFGTSADL